MYSLLVIIFVLRNAVIQAVQVIGGSVSVIQGDTAVFPCFLTETTESLTQITWQRRTRLIKDNTNFYTILKSNGPFYVNGQDERFHFVGNFSLRNGSLQLSNVTLSDEGTYTCIYTLFPSGNVKTEIPLNVLVPPETTLKDNFLTVGNEEVVLAICKAAYFWPSANVGWDLGRLSLLLRVTNNSTQNADGTTTTVSTLLGTPTRNLHNHSIQCVVRSPALPNGTTLPLNIQIHFPPSEVRIRELSKTSFECVSEANPEANYTWRSGLPWSDSAVKVSGAVLQILNPSPHVNGLFECKATNTYGTNLGHLYLHLSSEGSSTAGWILFGLLLFINIAVAAWCIYRSDKKFSIPCLDTSEDETRETGTALEPQGPEVQPLNVEVPPSSSPS
ncbi:poliovirus receptor-like isoform X2 [Boleophthalmus pectinirostris]|uniref:poliovirus receptor-like isoform X2 n=1 Tax=Boleophthalmus pectinirostris TaxID=150288 RepID=UPI00242A8E5F|nr:poliovirus receptor-like isoform X2 [Boleophthalmus pectinirostris]